MKIFRFAVATALALFGLAVALNPRPPSWDLIQLGDPYDQVFLVLPSPDAHSSDDTSFWVSAKATFPLFYRLLRVRIGPCENCTSETEVVVEKRETLGIFYFVLCSSEPSLRCWIADEL